MSNNSPYQTDHRFIFHFAVAILCLLPIQSAPAAIATYSGRVTIGTSFVPLPSPTSGASIHEGDEFEFEFSLDLAVAGSFRYPQYSFPNAMSDLSFRRVAGTGTWDPAGGRIATSFVTSWAGVSFWLAHANRGDFSSPPEGFPQAANLDLFAVYFDLRGSFDIAPFDSPPFSFTLGDYLGGGLTSHFSDSDQGFAMFVFRSDWAPGLAPTRDTAAGGIGGLVQISGPIPEPASAALVFSGLALSFRRRRRSS